MIDNIPERLCRFALRLLALCNLAFIALFLLVATIAVGRAAECTGEDMMAELVASNPATLATIREEAAATRNGHGLLWKVEKPGTEPSWLFGTMHMADPRVLSLPEQAQAAFDTSSTVVIETTDALDQSRMMAALASRPDLMMFTDGTTLTSLLSPADRTAIEAALKTRGISLASVNKMKPWMIASILALPACEMTRKAEGDKVLDQQLAADALAHGKKLEGLETAADQLGAMAGLPMEFHLRGLVETVALGDRMDDVIETMILLYKTKDVGTIWPLFRHALPAGAETGDQDSGYAAFEETMVTARNHTMAERAAPILAKGNAFIAVGALHLPGDEGIVELLRRQGYTVTEGG